MAKSVVPRKQLLKEPDQFITTTGKLISFGQSHLKAILICAGAALLSLLAVVTVHNVSVRNANRASELVEKAVAKYSAALADTNPKMAYDQVKTDFSDLFRQYGSKNPIKLARIIYGDISYNAGDADTAIAMYTHALEDFQSAPALENIVLNGLGYAYLLKKDYPSSVRYFETLVHDKETPMKSGALFNLAWMYDATGEKEKSLAAYKQLIGDFPKSLYGELVREKVGG